jgi:hypothetical protein
LDGKAARNATMSANEKMLRNPQGKVKFISFFDDRELFGDILRFDADVDALALPVLKVSLHKMLLAARRWVASRRYTKTYAPYFGNIPLVALCQ